MSSIESHFSNKPKEVFFLTQYTYLILLHTLFTLLYIFNYYFLSFNVNFFNLQIHTNSIEQVVNILTPIKETVVATKVVEADNARDR